MRNQLGVLLVAAILILAAPSVGHAYSLIRLFPESQMNGFYGTSIPLVDEGGTGDFGTTMVFGFYLDLTSDARYASLHYDTFVQLFTHQTRFDRAGQGQYVSATDDENISPTTKLHFSDIFYRDASVVTTITTSDQSPQFNSVLALLILANDQASINQFNAAWDHYWGEKWSSEVSLHQTTFFTTGNNPVSQTGDSYVQSAYADTDYHFSGRFSVGAGYRFYDWRFSFPGQPGEQAHWPLVRVNWEATKQLYLSGIMGVVISHTQGQGDQVNAAGLGSVSYTWRRGTIGVSGGQEPSLTSAFGTVGLIRGFRGSVLYYFTPRLTGTAGGSFYDASGSDFSGQFASWGLGLSQRVNKWLSLNTRFIEVKQNETAPSRFLSSNLTSADNGEWATGDYFIVGLSVSFEAFRWSWQ
jgi:hypothetical protein